MLPKSITGDQNHVVCFPREKGVEIGIAFSQADGFAYCVRQVDDEVRGCTGDSWDDLLWKLVDKDPDAARMLLKKGVAFVNPEETMAKAVASKIILNARITSSEGTVLIVIWAETEETSAIMAANGWKKYCGLADTFAYDHSSRE